MREAAEARPGRSESFVDPEGYKAHVDQFEKSWKSFEAAVAKRQAQGAGNPAAPGARKIQ